MKINSPEFKKIIEQKGIKFYSEEDIESIFQGMFDSIMPKFLDRYLPSKTFKDIDPVAYREEFLNYIDSLIKDDLYIRFEDQFIDKEELEKALSEEC